MDELGQDTQLLIAEYTIILDSSLETEEDLNNYSQVCAPSHLWDAFAMKISGKPRNKQGDKSSRKEAAKLRQNAARYDCTQHSVRGNFNDINLLP